MNGTKIKNFLILLLAAVNIFLAVNLFMASSANSHLSDGMLSASAEALSRRGIYVEKSMIPAEKYTQGVISVKRSSKTLQQAADAFLGEIVAEYSLPDGTTFQSDNAYMTFFDDGRFEYGISEGRPGKAPTPSSPPKDLANVKRSVAKSARSAFGKLAANAGLEKLTCRLLGGKSAGGIDTVYLQMLVDGLPMYGGNIVMTLENGTLTYMSGQYAFDTVEASYSFEYIDAPNALFLLNESDISIQGVEMIYYPVVSEQDGYFLIPSWQITCEDGKVHIYDGVSKYKRQ